MTLLSTSFPVAQWLERPAGVREVMGSIPDGDSDLFLCSQQLPSLFLPPHRTLSTLRILAQVAQAQDMRQTPRT